jgi:hypothetical protein
VAAKDELLLVVVVVPPLVDVLVVVGEPPPVAGLLHAAAPTIKVAILAKATRRFTVESSDPFGMRYRGRRFPALPVSVCW